MLQYHAKNILCPSQEGKGDQPRACLYLTGLDGQVLVDGLDGGVGQVDLALVLVDGLPSVLAAGDRWWRHKLSAVLLQASISSNVGDLN